MLLRGKRQAQQHAALWLDLHTKLKADPKDKALKARVAQVAAAMAHPNPNPQPSFRPSPSPSPSPSPFTVTAHHSPLTSHLTLTLTRSWPPCRARWRSRPRRARSGTYP